MACESVGGTSGIHRGRAIDDYEREGHSSILEQWLRRRGFIRHVFAAWSWIIVYFAQFIDDPADLADMADGLLDVVT